MTLQTQLRVKPEIAYQDLRLAIELSTKLDIDVNRIKRVDILKRSIDARQRQIMVNLTVRLHLDSIDPECAIFSPIDYRPISEPAKTAVVVGAGPAGLFAALRLIELGIKPIVLERGKDVDSRKIDMAKISRENLVTLTLTIASEKAEPELSPTVSYIHAVKNMAVSPKS